MEKNSSNKPFKILIVDDSAFNRRTLTKMLESYSDIKVVGTAINGKDALKEVKRLKPDLITLDIEMPEMDGFTFLRILMKTDPLPVIVLSSRDGDRDVFKAMELGAVDFIPKPTKRISNQLFDIKSTLYKKISTISQLKIKDPETIYSKELKKTIKPDEKKLIVLKEQREKVIAIGASTGGPPAIHWILSQINRPIDTAIVISQHMPHGFTKAFAERINKDCCIRVKEAEHGETVSPEKVLITPGGYHMTFRKKQEEVIVHLVKGTQKDKYIPSIDMMFTSASSIWGKDLTCIVLTGMGSDGAKGSVKIKENGGHVIAESKETALISSMPDAAISSGSVEQVMPIYEIGSFIANKGK